MSLELILGRAGSGKTETCIRQIGERLAAGSGEEEYIFLTPEQATFANEKRLLKALGSAGGLRVKVLSFRRFVHWVLQETGGGLLPPLDTVGKSLVLRSILEEKKHNLKAFQRVWNKKGFVEQLTALMEELRIYRVDPPLLLSCLDSGEGSAGANGGTGSQVPSGGAARQDLPPDLAGKLADIAGIFQDYEAFLSRGWLDLAGELTLLCEKLPAWSRLKQVSFWLDGFHGFTPAEFQVIRCLLAAGRPVKITLNLPRGYEQERLEEDDLFYPPWETARDLREICRQGGFAMEPPIYMAAPGRRRFQASPAMARLEAALAGGSEAGARAAADWSGIRLASCGDMRQEVERLAVEILEAARDEGLRYKDMVVLLRRPEAYESLFHSILPSYGIPYFFDGAKPLRYHPLICLLKELLVILKDRWSTGTLMAYVKTGLSGLSDNQGDALENYCLAYGIQRMHWESRRPWSFTAPDDPDKERIDAYMEGLRQKLWRPIQGLRKTLEQASTIEKMVEAVYEHLRELKAEETCSRWANEALEKGEPELAQIHQRTWQKIMELFDQTVLFLTPVSGGQEPLAAEDNDSEREGAADMAAPAAGKADAGLLAAVWESGLEALEMAALPPALDQVTICSMDRSRSPLAAKVWILGANEGVLPAHIQEDGLLAAAERQWLAQKQVYLAPDSRRRMFSEAYLIYIALTRASQSLSISCARADTQGKSQAASPLLEQLCRWFPGLAIEEKEPALIRQLTRPAMTLQLLGLALQSEERSLAAKEADGLPDDQWEGLWRFVFQWFYRQEAYRRDMRRLEAAYDLAPLGKPLPKALAERLFGRIIKTSITRLEQFQACPFAHFLAFGLKLEPREEYEVRPPAIGNFFHDSLETLINQVKDRGLFLGSLGQEELEAWVEKVAKEQLAQKSHEIFLTSAWYRSLSDNLNRILQSSVRALAYQEGQGNFRPYALEAAFGFDEPGSLPPLALELGEDRRILLRGRIDRIDQAFLPQTGQQFLRVVDYKSGHKTLALHEVFHGLKLQLVLYMEAALAALPQARPAGLFYFQVHDPILRAANIREALDEQWRQEKMIKAQSLQGYLLQDREVAILMDRNYGKSLFLPVAELKSGEFGRNSKLLTDDGFRLLGGYSRRLLNTAGQRIMEGDISLSPYQTGKKNACVYCPYGSVCRFDPAMPGHSYRYLPAFNDQAVLHKLKEESRVEKLE